MKFRLPIDDGMRERFRSAPTDTCLSAHVFTECGRERHGEEAKRAFDNAADFYVRSGALWIVPRGGTGR